MTDNQVPELPPHAAATAHPPKVLLLWILAGVALGFLVPVLHLPGWLRLLGLMDALAAFGLFLWCMGTFKRVGTDVKLDTPADALATDGPYAFSRNPIYLSMIVLGLGLGVALSNIWLLAGAPIFYYIINERVIKAEETYMAAKFGPDYAAYCQKVRRWI